MSCLVVGVSLNGQKTRRTVHDCKPAFFPPASTMLPRIPICNAIFAPRHYMYSYGEKSGKSPDSSFPRFGTSDKFASCTALKSCECDPFPSHTRLPSTDFFWIFSPRLWRFGFYGRIFASWSSPLGPIGVLSMFLHASF